MLQPAAVAALFGLLAAPSARVLRSGPDALWREGKGAWQALAGGERLRDGAELRAGGAALVIGFAEGSRLELDPGTQVALHTLEDALSQPLIEIGLASGTVRAQVALATVEREAFSVDTPFGFAQARGPRLRVQRPGPRGLVTVVAERGPAYVQPERREMSWPVELQEGWQVSLSADATGEPLPAGTRASLAAPREVRHFGRWSVCEESEGRERCQAWNWDDRRQLFEVVDEEGARSFVRVKALGGGEVVLERRESPGASAGAVTRYVGRAGETEFEGCVAVSTLGGRFSGSTLGGTREGTWSARSSFLVELGP